MTTLTLIASAPHPLQDIHDEISFLDSMLYCEVYGVHKQQFILNNPWNLSKDILKYKIKHSEFVCEFEKLDDRSDLLGRLINKQGSVAINL